MRLNRQQLAALFKKVDKSIVCQVDGVEVLINKRYETFAALNIEIDISTMGIFNINYKGEDYWYNLPGMITMAPTLIEDVKIDDEEYLKLTFNKGDIFSKNIDIVKRADLVFAIFKMFVFYNVCYPAMTPENVWQLFLHLYRTGFNMEDTDVVVASAAFTELRRSSKEEPHLLYRHKPVGKGFPIGMKNISITATKLTTRLGGSYLKSTLTSALVNESNQESQIEALLRR